MSELEENLFSRKGVSIDTTLLGTFVCTVPKCLEVIDTRNGVFLTSSGFCPHCGGSVILEVPPEDTREDLLVLIRQAAG